MLDNDDPGTGQPTPPPPASSDEPLKPDETPPAPQAAPAASAWQPQSGQPPKAKDLDQLDIFRDPEKLSEAASIFLKHGDDTGLAWLQHVHGALQENAVSAIQALQAGDGELAIKRFNKSGKYTDAKSASKNADGTWTLTRSNGQELTVDPDQEAAALMSPQHYAELQAKKGLIAAQIDYYKAHGRQADAAANFSNERATMQRDVADIRAAGQENAAKVRAIPQLVESARKSAAQEASDKFGLIAQYNVRRAEFAKPDAPPQKDATGNLLTPEEAATLSILRDPVMQRAIGYSRDPQSGALFAFDKGTGTLLRRFKDVDEVRRTTGLEPLIPPAAKTTPALSKPGSAPPAAPATAPKGRPFATGFREFASDLWKNEGPGALTR